jgi:hypothetical protein
VHGQVCDVSHADLDGDGLWRRREVANDGELANTGGRTCTDGWANVHARQLFEALNTEKTKVRYAGEESFDFLSHTHRLWRGKLVLDIADKAHRRTKDKLGLITRRTWLSLDALVEELNAYIRRRPALRSPCPPANAQ